MTQKRQPTGMPEGPPQRRQACANQVQPNADDHGPLEPNAEELGKFRLDFLKAVQRAERRAGLPHRQPRWQPTLRTAFTLGALAVLALVAVVLLARPRQLQALPALGLDAQIINGASGLPLPGVAVIEAGTKQLIDRSTSAGFVHIPAPAGAGNRDCLLQYGSEQVGRISVGGQPPAISGFARIPVKAAGMQEQCAVAVSVGAGQQQQVWPGAAVALAEGAAGAWNGELVKDSRWPAVLNFGRVVDGIYELRGESAPGLHLEVRLQAGQVSAEAGELSQLAVIAYDDRYAHDGQTMCNFHKGWFMLDQPRAGYLPHVTPAVSTSGDEVVVSWPAEPGRRYALLLPPRIDGTPTACWVPQRSGDKVQLFHFIELLNQQRSRLALYDVEYHGDDGTTYIVNQLPLHSRMRCSLDERLRPRGSDHDLQPFAKTDELTRIAGTFTIREYDFTLSQFAEYPPLRADFSELPPDLEIDYAQVPIGGVTKLALKGAPGQLAEPPRWDIGGDGTDDQFGATAELLVPYPGSYRVAVALRLPSGAAVRAERYIPYTQGAVAGYYYGGIAAEPILATVADAPAEQTERLAQTDGCVASPLAYGYSTGTQAGPLLLFTPPPELQGQPLDRLQVTLYMSPLSGDTGSVFLVPYIQPVMCDSLAENSAFKAVNGFFPGLPDFVHYGEGNISYEVDQALLVHSSGESARDYLSQFVGVDYNRCTGFSLELGLDLAQLPPEAELARILEQFKQGPHYQVRYVSQPRQQISWDVPLHHAVLQPGQALLVGACVETTGDLDTAQWNVYSGGATSASLQLTTADGRTYTQYVDYGLLDKQGGG